MTMQESLIKASLASGITIALLVGIASAAMAQEVTVVRDRPDPDMLTERVHYGDLNLASKQDVRVLKTRVGGAVHRVCLVTNGLSTYDGCKYESWSGARPQIGRAVKRARQIAQTGTSNIAPVAIVIAAH